MNATVENLNRLGEHFLDFAWPMLWQSSLLFALVFIVDFALARKIRASVRHALWLVVLVKLLLPPTLALPTGAAWWLFPAKPAGTPPVASGYAVNPDNAKPLPALSGDSAPIIVTEPRRRSSLHPPFAGESVPLTVPLAEPPPPKLEGAGWALLAASATSATLLVWLSCRWRQLARKVRAASLPEKLGDILQHARGRAGLQSCIRLKLVDGDQSPAVCGLFRPVILLPRMLAERLSAAQLRAVLLHEALHIQRKDIWVNCAQSLLQIIYWWHPLLWLANARIRRVREEAVDDAVMLALDAEAEIYVPTLLEVARLALRRPLLSLGLVGIMESRSALRQRIERLLAFRAPRQAGLTLASACGIFVFSAVALPMGAGPAPVARGTAADASPPNGTNEAKPVMQTQVELNDPISQTNDPLPGAKTDYNRSLGESRALAREKIIALLDHIHLARVSFEGLSLKEVVRQLTEAAKQNDPEKFSIHIPSATNWEDALSQVNEAVEDLVSHKVDLQISTATNSIFTRWDEINSIVIKLPSLTNVRLADVLDAVILVADKPIQYSVQDDGIVFSATETLFQRTFRLGPSGLRLAMENARAQTGSKSNAWDSHASVVATARELFSQLGVNWNSPAGKSVFYGDKLGYLFVKATESDLDTIERVLQVVPQTAPQVHLQARFYEVSKQQLDFMSHKVTAEVTVQLAPPRLTKWIPSLEGSLNLTNPVDGTPMGILPRQHAREVMRAMPPPLAEPEITALSGRQVHLWAKRPGANGTLEQPAVAGQTNLVEIEPVVELIPYVLADDYAINLVAIPSLAAFPGNGSVPLKTVHSSLVTSVNLLDGESLVLNLPDAALTKELLIFITPTLVDPAGSRIHPDDEHQLLLRARTNPPPISQ